MKQTKELEKLKNSTYENISPEQKKMWNNECIEIFGDDSKEGRTLMYKDSEISTWKLVLDYIEMGIRDNNQISTKKECVKFLVEKTDKKKSIIYSAIKKLRKRGRLLECKKYLIPNPIPPLFLKLIETVGFIGTILSNPLLRMIQNEFEKRKKQIIKDFIKRQ